MLYIHSVVFLYTSTRVHVQTLEAVDHDRVSPGNVMRLGQYLQRQDFTPSAIARSCRAGKGLMMWAHAVYEATTDERTRIKRLKRGAVCLYAVRGSSETNTHAVQVEACPSSVTSRGAFVCVRPVPIPKQDIAEWRREQEEREAGEVTADTYSTSSRRMDNVCSREAVWLWLGKHSPQHVQRIGAATAVAVARYHGLRSDTQVSLPVTLVSFVNLHISS